VAEDYPPTFSIPLLDRTVAVAESVAKSAVGQLNFAKQLILAAGF
jgi:hypothetical protein